MIQCLAKLEIPEQKSEAKMELITIGSDLMPAGKPEYLGMVKYPMIRDLVKETGKATMLKALFLLVKDFCSSMNVVRNMNEDQMIEAAAMLLDECDNFRMEDYLMMFQLAKRGVLAKILDRIDLQVITSIMDEYWSRRREAGKTFQEEGLQHLDSLGSKLTILDQMNPMDRQLTEAANGFLGALDHMKTRLTEWRETNGE